jgi:hypothetical protein
MCALTWGIKQTKKQIVEKKEHAIFMKQTL